MSVLAIIPARGGSKRLPGKNMRDLGGMPLVGWSIAQAIASRPYIDAIAVSSDDEDILSYSRMFNGIDVIRRPAELATDKADSYCVIRHAYHEMGGPYDFICLLQPTSPLRLPADVVRCIGAAHALTTLPAVVSYEDGKSVPNGAVYVGRTDWLLDGGNFDAPSHVAYRMPAERSVDIDTKKDFEKAENLLWQFRRSQDPVPIRSLSAR